MAYDGSAYHQASHGRLDAQQHSGTGVGSGCAGCLARPGRRPGWPPAALWPPADLLALASLHSSLCSHLESDSCSCNMITPQNSCQIVQCRGFHEVNLYAYLGAVCLLAISQRAEQGDYLRSCLAPSASAAAVAAAAALPRQTGHRQRRPAWLARACQRHLVSPQMQACCFLQQCRRPSLS